MLIEKISDIDPSHNMKINQARLQADGTRLWFVSFATSQIRDGEQQYGYFQNFYEEPKDYDILATYNNFLELIRRG